MTDADVRALIDDPIAREEVSAVELTLAFLNRLDGAGELHAMITITPELALSQARESDHRRGHGDRLPLDGLPIVLKDNVDVGGVRTTVGSRLFGDGVPSADAEVTRRLRGAGAVILGKANMHELAFGATSANETYGAVVNPLAPDRIPGGSSGGSGAAVAADLCVAAIGTDTGGSVRLPASLCGVSGLRPSYGAVSNRGVHPVSPTLDTVGPLARSAADVRDVLAVIAGFDADDPTSVDRALELSREVGARGLRIGIVETLVERSDDGVGRCVRDVAHALEGLGAVLASVDLPGWEAASEACGHLIRADARTRYAQVLTTRPALLEEGTRRRLARAAGHGADDRSALEEERRRWAHVVERVLAEVDLLLLPTIPVEPPLAQGADSVVTTDQVVPYTFLLALASVPSLSIPCGATAGGAPVGAQLAAARWRDGLVLQAAAAVQAETDWHRRRPS